MTSDSNSFRSFVLPHSEEKLQVVGFMERPIGIEPTPEPWQA